MQPTLADQISSELRLLVGHPLVCCLRAIDLVMIDFGTEREVLTRTGARIMRSPIHLHLQCRWRVCDGEGIVFGSDDLFHPGSETMDADAFDYADHLSALDVLHGEWFARHAGPSLEVVAAEGDRFGGFRITLAGGMTLECLPCESRRDSELWRLCGHRADDSHFVVLASGVEPRDGDLK